MEAWVQHVNRARTLQIVLILGIAVSFTLGNENNSKYSIVEEHHTCGHIIPKFIEQIMNQKTSTCDESGVFPKPGNCSVFFKCAQQSDTRIQPFIEYCAVGYNFVNSVCVPNTNLSDCPQYTCRIPDGTNEIGNEVEVNDENSFQSLPLVVPSSTSVVILEPMSSTEASIEETTANSKDQTDQSNAFMQMTQTQENSSASPNIRNKAIISLCVVIAVSINCIG